MRAVTAGVEAVDQIAKRNPVERPNKGGKAPFTSLKVDALPKLICRLDPGHTGLTRIDLPRVDVKNVGGLRAQNPAHAPQPHQIGSKAEVAATAPRDSALAQPNTRNTDFVKTIAEQDDRAARIHPVQLSIAIMREGWHKRRIVIKAHVVQDRFCPFGVGEARGAVSPDRPAC